MNSITNDSVTIQYNLTPTIAANGHSTTQMNQGYIFNDFRERKLKSVSLSTFTETDKPFFDIEASFGLLDRSSVDLKGNIQLSTASVSFIDTVTPSKASKDIYKLCYGFKLIAIQFNNGATAFAGLDTISFYLTLDFEPI